MDRTEYRRIEALFQEAVDLTTDERAAFLAARTEDEPDLCAVVSGLLASVDSRRVASLHAVDVSERAPLTGTRIGPYRVLELIGEGGFGAVYLAEQQEPIRRRVALKVLRPGMDTARVIARFERERQTLALMDHPQIAAVLDAGATESGRPYFAMDLVRGTPITEYCDLRGLGIRDRLHLLLGACRAVQHAHVKGVIHRDLKPSNVLVEMRDGEPVATVIDFGIAKAAHGPAAGLLDRTEGQPAFGTPGYVSPEQAASGGRDVDTRADVYSLGAVLHEMLCGLRPHDDPSGIDSTGAPPATLDSWRDPPPPSAVVTARGMRGVRDARARGLEPAGLARALAGDLDWITVRALEPDRSRRYDSVAELAADLGRHLRDEPVLAGSPRLTYRVGKFVRRHRTGVLATALVACVVLVGTVLSSVGFLRAERARRALVIERDAAEAARRGESTERQRAETALEELQSEAEHNRNVVGFLSDMLTAVNPRHAPGGKVTVRMMLDRAAKRLDDGTLSARAEVEASVRATLGAVYTAQGVLDPALVQMRAAHELRQSVLGDCHEQTAESAMWIGKILALQGRLEESERWIREAVENAHAAVGPDHPLSMASRNALIRTLQERRRYHEAESSARALLEQQREVLGEAHPDALETARTLAVSLWVLGRLDEAETLLRETFAIARKTRGLDDFTTLRTLIVMASVVRGRGRLAEAERLLRATHAGWVRRLGRDDLESYGVEQSLAEVLAAQGKIEEAEERLVRVLVARRRLLGPDHPRTREAGLELCGVRLRAGKTAEARALLLPLATRIADGSAVPASAVMTGGTLIPLTCARLLLLIPGLRPEDRALAVRLLRCGEAAAGVRAPRVLSPLADGYEAAGCIQDALRLDRLALERMPVAPTPARTALEAALLRRVLRARGWARALEATALVAVLRMATAPAPPK